MKMRIILIGGSETVYYLARQLQQRDHHLTIINRNEAHCMYLVKQTDATVIHGDGSDQRMLEEAGARQADIVLALTPHDEDNLVSCQIAQRIYGVPRTIALCNDPENEEIFKQLGVTHAFSSTRVIAELIEQRTNFDEIVNMMPLADGKLHVSNLKLERDSPAVGQSLVDLNLSENTLVACLIRDGEVIIPRGNNQLQVGDQVLVISQPGHEEADLALLVGDKT